MKTYVLILAKTFPKGHPRAGQPTYFKEKFLHGNKFHTLRGNCDRWGIILTQVCNGEAELSIRQWRGVPYHSKQEVIKNLNFYDGVGYEIINMTTLNKHERLKREIAMNDGMALKDWEAWFNKELHSKTAVYRILIHFTTIRYKDYFPDCIKYTH